MGIHFSYVNRTIPTDPHVISLDLRLDPYNVSWNYNLNTAQYDTYDGQVIQILSINIDNLTIDGTFGREGPFGVSKNGNDVEIDPRWGGKVPPKGWITNNVDQQFLYPQRYPGLYALWSFFTDYFSVSAQGGDARFPGQFIQQPMTVTYDTGPFPSASADAGVGGSESTYRQWLVTPISFPNFSRANAEFAPLWKIEFSVVQADPHIVFAAKNDAIAKISALQDGIGWTAQNPWADAGANPADNPAVITNQIVNEFSNILPKLSEGDLQALIWNGVSGPNIQLGPLADPGTSGTPDGPIIVQPGGPIPIPRPGRPLIE